MSRRVICVFIVSLVGLIAGPVRAQIESENILGAWLFDEGNGDTTADATGNGHNGTLAGSPAWVGGQFGNALNFDGSSSYVDCGSDEALNVELFSVSFWCNFPDVQAWNHMISRGQHGASGSPGSVNWGVMMYEAQETILFETFNDTGWTGISAPTSAGEWHHVVATYDGDAMQLYHDGTLAASNSGIGILLDETRAFIIGGRSDAGSVGGFFDGSLDDVGYFNVVLTPEDIDTIMNEGLAEVLGGSTVAVDPQPAHDQIDVPRDTGLSWVPGMFANTHDVYVGTSFADVDAASVDNPLGMLASKGQDTNAFDPEGVYEFEQTYYWRVDEVNAAPDNTVFKGAVWSFTTEPYSIQIPGSSIAVTASSHANEFSRPDNTINGSGLGADNTHVISSQDMWFTATVDLDPWIQYEFDAIQKLDMMRVWNSNSAAEMAIGWGIKDVEIAYSVDGENWDVLADANQFSRAPGLPTYDSYDEIAFGGVAAKYVRLNIGSNWGGILMSYSLSEIQFDMIPAKARTPVPASGSVDLPPNTVVSWRAGREAVEHTIYVSADQSEVADGLAPTVTSTTNRADLSSLDLQLGTTYYWRVDEVNEADAMPVWAGPVWSFSTVAALVVDDFESYNNFSPDRPFQTWHDGYGFSSDEYFPNGYGGNGTGAGIGHDIWNLSSPHFDGDIMETASTIAGSRQSMPFYYTNTGGVSSYTERTFSVPQDWTIGGAITLSIAFRGQTGNTGTLYVKINNTKIVYDGDVNKGLWLQWPIDLNGVGGLQNVSSLTIGVDGASAAGMLYIDNIHLSPLPSELLVPPSPLAAFWNLDEGTGTAVADSSGNGNDGSFVGEPIWVAGQVGTALQFDGIDDYVEVPHHETLTVYNEAAVALWMNPERYNSEGEGWGGVMGKGTPRAYSLFTTSAGNLHFSTSGVGSVSNGIVPLNEWSHVVAMVIAGSHAYYINGDASGGGGSGIVLPGASNTAPATFGNINETARFYQGMLDDVRVYNRALSEEEVNWLASGTALVEMP